MTFKPSGKNIGRLIDEASNNFFAPPSLSEIFPGTETQAHYQTLLSADAAYQSRRDDALMEKMVAALKGVMTAPNKSARDLNIAMTASEKYELVCVSVEHLADHSIKVQEAVRRRDGTF